MSEGEGAGRKRSRTKCEKIRESKGTATIEFDELGAPVGKYASQFASFYAMMVKDMVSPAFKSWKVVPLTKKEEVWEQIKDHFNITKETKVAKKRTIKMMGERWKNWKADLVKKFIKKSNPKNPCDEWTINEADWIEFKRQKNSAEWQEMSARGTASVMKPKVPHHLGSTGYRGALIKWNKAKEQANSSSSISALTEGLDERSERWVLAWCLPNEEGVFVPQDQRTQEVIEKVRSLRSGDAGQRLPPCDILTTAIGTPEHPGRLRGYSGHVGKKAVYGKSKRGGPSHANCFSSKQEFDQAVQKVVEEKVAQQLQTILGQLWGQQHDQWPGAAHSPKGSQPATQVCSNNSPESNNKSPGVPFRNTEEGPIDCSLYVLDVSNQRIKVADGRCYPSKGDVTVHHKPLKSDQLKVSIDKVIDEYREWNAPFPLDDGTDRLGELINTFLIWPACLVGPLLQAATPQKTPTKAKVTREVPTALSVLGHEPLLLEEQVRRLSEEGGLLYQFLMVQPKDLVQLSVPYDEATFSAAGELLVNVSDLTEMLKREEANISILKLFCMYCKKRCQEVNTAESERVYFLDPEKCAHTYLRVDLPGTTSYINEIFDRVGVQPAIILLPYHERGHWVLLVIDLLECKVHLVDSLCPKMMPNLKIKLALDSALRHHWKDDKKSARFTWKFIEGPKQQDAVSCGYYVMVSMFNIIMHYVQAGQVLPSEMQPKAPASYAENHLNEVVNVLAEFFLEVV